jgi:hypothetical protein
MLAAIIPKHGSRLLHMAKSADDHVKSESSPNVRSAIILGIIAADASSPSPIKHPMVIFSLSGRWSRTMKKIGRVAIMMSARKKSEDAAYIQLAARDLAVDTDEHETNGDLD